MDVKMDTLKNDARCHIAVWRGRGTPDLRRGHLLGGNGLRGEPLQGGAQHKPPVLHPIFSAGLPCLPCHLLWLWSYSMHTVGVQQMLNTGLDG